MISEKNRLIIKEKLLQIRSFKKEHAILIFSEPRGGSTWVMEVFMQNPKVLINWEPFHKKLGVVPHSFNWGWLATTNNCDKIQLIEFLHDVIVFRLTNAWVIKYTLFKNIFSAKYVLTKFVRANRLLQFIIRNINLSCKPIYILRHPITTCISQLKTFNRIEPNEMFSPGSKTMQLAEYDIKDKYLEKFLRSLQTPLEQKIAYWCMNNRDNIKQMDTHYFYTVFYEDLVLNPEEEFSKMFKSLDLKIFDGFGKFNFRKPSTSNYRNDFRKNPEEQLKKFQKLFHYDELNRIQSILDIFEIKVYSAFHHLPMRS